MQIYRITQIVGKKHLKGVLNDNKSFKATVVVRGKKWCLVVFKDLIETESLLFTECQNLISLTSYHNFNFGNLIGSLINFRTKMKF